MDRMHCGCSASFYTFMLCQKQSKLLSHAYMGNLQCAFSIPIL